jgi:hypothetical protein
MDPVEAAVSDVAAAGGWNHRETLLTCYQPGGDTMLRVMSETRKLRDGSAE